MTQIYGFRCQMLTGELTLAPDQVVTPKLHVRIQALQSDQRTLETGYNGVKVRVDKMAPDMAFGLTGVYDGWGDTPTPDGLSGTLYGGEWEGYVTAKLDPANASRDAIGKFVDISIRAIDLSGQPQGGSSNWTRVRLAEPTIPEIHQVEFRNKGQRLTGGQLADPLDLEMVVDGVVRGRYGNVPNPITGGKQGSW